MPELSSTTVIPSPEPQPSSSVTGMTQTVDGPETSFVSSVTTSGDAAPHDLDLYVCCQCPTTILISSTPIPGVISVKDLDALVKEKEENPKVGSTKDEGVVYLLDTILSYVPNPSIYPTFACSPTCPV